MITVSNQKLAIEFSEVGATVAALYFDGRKIADKGYTVGRYANRICKGRFSLNGTDYQLNCNDRGNHLHGGPGGLKERTWELKELGEAYAAFHIFSPDGEENYPGNLDVDVEFSLAGDALEISYTAYSDADTVVNFTNHTYFNLNGECETGSAFDHRLQLNAERYTEVDDVLIPTGRLLPVEGTGFDFRKMRDYDHNLDHNFCLSGEGLRRAGELVGTKSGLHCEIYTDQPGIQIYNSESQICLETQHYPDSPNHPDFPSTLLPAGGCFTGTTVYRFSK